MRGLLTALLLPPLSLVLLGLLGGLLAWRGRRPRLGGLLAVTAAGLLLLLATPFCADFLLASLEERVRPGELQPAGAAPPEAIVILGGDGARDGRALDVGPLTLERLRAGAALHRRTGLPVLVTAGRLSPGEPPLGPVMAESLARDFGVPVRWVEARAGNTRENAVLSAEMLRAAGIGSAWLVTHGWHMPRAQEAFARAGLATAAAPVRRAPPPAEGVLPDGVPRPDHLAESWFALREWAGRLVYALGGG
jgi:uncharacterized SAM-binding protein YcdF (DUF218 family)